MKNYVTIDHTVAAQALDWVKECCPQYITNDYSVNDNGVKIDFYFGTCPAGQQQMTMFALRWYDIR